MDFRELLNVADYNKTEASHEASIKRFSSELPPPKKMSKAGVQMDGIAKFLAKRKAAEEAKAAEAKKLKEQLLALRAKSTKNSKKAKIMASRTKDNDFSRIKLTDDEVIAKKKREAELVRQNCANKVERMKARIEMEEKEKLLPKKRKRKCKNGEYIDHDHPEQLRVKCKEDLNARYKDDSYKDSSVNARYKDDSHKDSSVRYKDSSDLKKVQDKSSEKNSQKRTVPKPQPPAISFAELLKVAEKKQFEPVEIVQKKKDDEKPMTKKERKLLLEERERMKRKEQRLLQESNGITSKSNTVSRTNNANKDLRDKKSNKSKNPVVIHVEKDKKQSKPIQESGKFNIPKGATNVPISKNVPFKSKDLSASVTVNKSGRSKPGSDMPLKSEQKKGDKSRDERTSQKSAIGDVRKSVVPKKNSIKINPVSAPPPVSAPAPAPQFDEAAITASIEKRIREKIEKELEEKMLAKFAQMNGLTSSSSNTASVSDKKVAPVPKPNIVKVAPVQTPSTKKAPDKPSQKDIERMMIMKRRAMEKKKLESRGPVKKPFHTNPYLDPPRRLLEPQIRRPPTRPRIESSDEDDEDDMSDFIDDGPGTQNEDDYSKYIKEIFGYDKNKYVDYDDDDIMESSYAQQQKEEIESTKAGIREDLEEERKELERKKRQKLKK